MRSHTLALAVLTLSAAVARANPVTKEAPAPAAAPVLAQAPAAPPERAALERKVDILTDEVQKLRERLVIPEKEVYKSVYGLGPAASKVYRLTSGLSIGGYAEMYLERRVQDKGATSNTADALRYVQYVGYKFSDKFVLNAEIEFEHATTGLNFEGRAGSVSAEFAYLDYLAHPAINVRAGLVLVPMGFINEIHEPPFFHGVLRPAVEQVIIPTTWRELGVGIFGEPVSGLSYKLYAVGGLNAQKFAAGGWRGGRQSGNQILAEDFALVGRLDYRWGDLFTVGASAYYGGADQGRVANVDTTTFLFEGHAQVRWRGFELRGLAAYGTVSNAEGLTTALFTAPADAGKVIGSEVYGWYLEAAYDLWPLLSRKNLYLAPYFRYERYDTQYKVPELAGRSADTSLDVTIAETGLTFKPHPQLVVKVNYRNTSNAKGSAVADAMFFGVGAIY